MVVDADADIQDWDDVMWRIHTTVMPGRDVVIGPRTLKSVHDPFLSTRNFHSLWELMRPGNSKKSVILRLTRSAKGTFLPHSRAMARV
ncbi:MAG: hypothetical protein ACREBS_03355 [Nitrososphaerales archaeon]